MTLLAAVLLVLSAPSQQPVDTSGIAALFGRYSMGRGCPVGPDVMYTAAHVVEPAPFNEFARPTPMRWSIGSSSGTVYVVEIDAAADLAMLKSVQAFPKWYEIADGPPQLEEQVALVGYDYSKPSKAFTDKIFLFRITSVIAGHLIYSGGGEPGSSGSCVLNEAGKVVGINIGYMPTANLKKAGLGVGLWKH